MSIINFKCKKCGSEFDFEVGKVRFTDNIDDMVHFEREICCVKCGILRGNEVELTELGQSQLTRLYLANSH